ncbi:thioesterase domain-containing protein [Arsenicicoccus sp. oral taxon 190]|uniref:thioesterase domain-containing protein n=1 Tax=Arsenicicoccus sp. oral taxon 190 TaxID=1658671 RepID=UPI000679F603|nr:thioesterase domain-containing protein [Arsenicicoccus sp. oral taxon 190]AKT51495.1 hypothetical protein ADJ73_09540 [Arsenicicoccus sp. oral taxon 190]
MTDAGPGAGPGITGPRVTGPRITGIDGGAGGTRVVVEDVVRLAGLCRAAGSEVHDGAVALSLARAALLVEGTAALSPVTAAHAGMLLQRATFGPDSPVVVAGGAGTLGLGLTAAAHAYDAVEVANTALWEAAGVAAVVGDVATAAACPQRVMTDAGQAYLGEVVEAGRPLGAEEAGSRWASDHALDLEQRVEGVAVLGSVLPLAASVGGRAVVGEHAEVAPVAVVAHELAPLWQDGDPEVAAVGPPVATTAPRSTQDLVRGLAETNREPDGTVAVRTITSGAGGRERHAVVVDVPGTDAWSLPGEQTDQVRDLSGNVTASAGEASAYARGVEEAVVTSGVPRDVPITLVGHSQGGMAATMAAERLQRRGYRVTHVVAVAAPIANLRQPAGVTTLALDGDRDLVTKADGRPNGDQAHRVTVRFDSGRSGVEVNHDLETYAAAAALVDDQGDREASLAPVLSSLRRDGAIVAAGEPSRAEVVHVRVSRARPRPGP